MESLMHSLGLPVKHSKTERATQKITHLGIMIDTNTMCLKLPIESRNRLLAELARWINHKYRTLKEYLSLKGWLIWIANVCPPIRSFIQPLSAKCRGMHVLHARLSINLSVKNSLRAISSIISQWSGLCILEPAFMCNPDITIYTDASGGVNSGGGVWIPTFNEYDTFVLTEQDIHISEAIVAIESTIALCNRSPGKSILLFVDNSIVTHALHRMASSNDHINWLLQRLAIALMRHNIRFRCLWIPTKRNREADLLSRHKLSLFSFLHPTANRIRTVIVPYAASDCA